MCPFVSLWLIVPTHLDAGDADRDQAGVRAADGARGALGRVEGAELDAVLAGGSAGFSSLEDPPPNRPEKKPPMPPLEDEDGVGAAGALEAGAGPVLPAIAVCVAAGVLLGIFGASA